MPNLLVMIIRMRAFVARYYGANKVAAILEQHADRLEKAARPDRIEIVIPLPPEPPYAALYPLARGPLRSTTPIPWLENAAADGYVYRINAAVFSDAAGGAITYILSKRGRQIVQRHGRNN